MNIQNVKRVFFLCSFGIFLIMMLIFSISAKVALFLRFFLVLFLAFFASYYKFKKKYSFISVIVAFFMATLIGIVMANSMWQFWFFGLTFIIGFFLAIEVLDRNFINI